MPISGWYSFLNHRLHLKKVISNEYEHEHEREHEHDKPSEMKVIYEVVNIPTANNSDGSVVKSEFVITESGISFQ